PCATAWPAFFESALIASRAGLVFSATARPTVRALCAIPWPIDLASSLMAILVSEVRSLWVCAAAARARAMLAAAAAGAKLAFMTKYRTTLARRFARRAGNARQADRAARHRRPTRHPLRRDRPDGV